MTHKYYKITDTIIHLDSIRTASLNTRENRIYIRYKTGDVRTEIFNFATEDEAKKEFMNLENILGVFEYV